MGGRRRYIAKKCISPKKFTNSAAARIILESINIRLMFATSRLLALSVIMMATFPNLAYSQITSKDYPSFRTSDPANVDVLTGLPFWSVDDLSIGSSDYGLSHSFRSYQASFFNPQDSFLGGASLG